MQTLARMNDRFATDTPLVRRQGAVRAMTGTAIAGN